MFEHFFRDIKENGLTAEFDYLDESPEFFWVPPGYTSALSYDSVRVILEGNADAYSSINYEWESVQIFPLTNDLANYTGIVEVTMVDTSGMKIESTLIESGVVIKRIDGWKYLSGQTAVLPAESTN